jgi:transposase-like protein
MGQMGVAACESEVHVARANAPLGGLTTVSRKRRSRSFHPDGPEPTVDYVANEGDAWSAYLRRMTGRPGWSVARLARDADLSRSTIFRWIAEGAEGITIQSVYLVADALGDDRAEALRAAGNLPPERDAEVELILSSNRTELEKVAMIDRLMRRREEERQRRLDDLRWMLGQETG